MTKLVKWWPNERVDIPDFDAGTNDLALGTVADLTAALVLDKLSRISSGFRVVIANQGTSPGQFTIVNGDAFDKDGQLVKNYEETNASRSATLLANAQYFVEVEYVTDLSNTDARAFWDETISNGLDPSGDPRPPGQEVSENVSTRLTQDWRIVTPISTTGFTFQSNPNTLRIPVAVIQRSGGVIVGASTVAPRSVLLASYNSGVSSVQVQSSVLMPDAFTATIGAEAVTVTANDRVNSILTLSAPTANAHDAGDRVVVTGGTTQVLVQPTTPVQPQSGTADARLLLWQGNEERGQAIRQNPDTASGLSDVQIASLKNYVDTVAAMIREMKYGSSQSTEAGQTAGAAYAGATAPRWYDAVQGLQGARAVTVSIGDGVTSWGDFNVSLYGSTEACFAAAIAALSGGGTLFVKRSAAGYTFATGNVAINSLNGVIAVVGESKSETILTAAGANPIFVVTDATVLLHNISLTKTSGAATHTLSVATSGFGQPAFFMTECEIHGIATSSAAAVSGVFSSVDFLGVDATQSKCMAGNVRNATFIGCNFDARSGDVNGRCVDLIGAFNAAWIDCLFSATTEAALVDVSAPTNPVTNLRFDDCRFEANGNVGFVNNSFPVDMITFRDCVFDTGLNSIYLDDARDVLIDNCVFTFESSDAIQVDTTSSNARIDIRSSTFTQSAGFSGNRAGIRFGALTDGSVIDCTFSDCDHGIVLATTAQVKITGNSIVNPTAGCGSTGIFLTTNNTFLSISENIISQIRDLTNANGCHGVRMTGVATDLSITNNKFSLIGGAASTNTACGVSMEPTAGVNLGRLDISGNEFNNITASATETAAGIRTTDSVLFGSISNNTMLLIGLNAGTCLGIAVAGGGGITITGNTVSLAGVVGQVAGILLSSGTSNTTQSTISGNVVSLAGLGGTPATSGGIVLVDAGRNITISGNVVTALVGTALNGIQVSNPGAVQVSDLVIANNQLGNNSTSPGFVVGINVALVGPGSGATGSERVSINGNQIRGAVTSVSVSGSNPVAQNISVTGNNIISNRPAAIGVALTSVQRFTVAGNTIDLTGGATDAKSMILCTTCSGGTISGNFGNIVAAAVNFGLIELVDTATVMVSGNNMQSTGTTPVGVNAVGTSANNFAIGNLFNTNGLGNGWAGMTLTKAASDGPVAPNIATNPSGLSDIGLNYVI